MIGKWIDSLSDEQRDRIIEHPDPTFSGVHWWSNARGCGCLVGCVVGAEMPEHAMDRDWLILRDLIHNDSLASKAAYKAGVRFPGLTARFTPERMWRVCKARAAKRNHVAVAPEVLVEA